VSLLRCTSASSSGWEIRWKLSQIDVNGGSMQCLTGRDLTDYDYVSVGKEGFVPINIKLTINITWLNNGEL
jgi:hypothetical protein